MSLDYGNIRSLTMDDYGNLWIASGITGLVKFDTKSKTQQFIPTFAARTYDLKLLSFIDSLNSKNNSICKLTEIGDFQDLKKEFTIEKQNEVMIVSVGEGLQANGMLDYGWLQDAKSDTVWSQINFNNSFYLSGATKNRITLE